MPSITLRLPTESDRRELLALRQASRKELEPWEPAPPSGTDVYGPEWFDRVIASCNTATRVRWVVCEKVSGLIVASVGIDQISRGPFNNGIMGWWCGTPYVNKGFMTAGIAGALDLAFRNEPLGLSLHRIEANIRPENIASLAVARKVGFRYEGHSPKYLQIAGKYCDHSKFAIVREDWHFLKQRAEISKK